MNVKMRVLPHQQVLDLNSSSARAGHNKQVKNELLPDASTAATKDYIVNFHFDHDWSGDKDVRVYFSR